MASTEPILIPPPAVSGPAPFIDTDRHPAVRRVADVLRSRAPVPRTIVIDDAECIEQAVAAGVRIEAIYATPDRAARAEGLHAGVPRADRFTVGEDVLRPLLSRDKASRLLALARAPRPSSWGEVAAARGDVLVLDGVRITGNVGAIVRSACAFGAAAVVLIDSGLRSAYDRRVIRASRGLVFAMPVLLADQGELVEFLRSADVLLASLAADAEEPLEGIGRHPDRMAILLGSERRGSSSSLEALADRRYAVSMAPGMDSLNVSVAAALALYERRRKP
ncbi:TrmH family RNA methyltransferase [Isoptericola halotolerans]|uniref:TrmH family RNA methyltransferase n=1 Tax=Isoptericola halotolerans TaxID=300560 RepID=A0ABX2AAD7_9MICO|nr:TrmH family RNA methyltransferase [Isoptericola halotolerans]NOV98911.1 TrmH family RNA methyltransferase [Isoptericola halotolerans]